MKESCGVMYTRLSHALALVVATSLADGVDVAPVAFWLRMLLWVTVDFARTGKEEARVHTLCKAKHVEGAHHVGLQTENEKEN